MTAPRHEEESSWDSLADDLGLPPETKEVARTVAQHRELSTPEQPIESPPPKVSVVEVVVPPSSDASVVLESPGHVTVSVVVRSDEERHPGEIVEVVNVGSHLIEESDEGSEEDGEEADAPRGKKRRRRRRRGRRGAEGTEGAETAEGNEPETDGDEPTPAPVQQEVELEDAPEADDDEEPEGEPLSAVDEEMEAEVAAPKQEWNVVSWVDLVATLHRPER